jgi:hypothetical protein
MAAKTSSAEALILTEATEVNIPFSRGMLGVAMMLLSSTEF